MTDTEQPPVDPNVGSVMEKMRVRARFGLEKYGQVTMGSYTRLEMLIHAQEEAMDLAVYLEELIRLEND